MFYSRWLARWTARASEPAPRQNDDVAAPPPARAPNEFLARVSHEMRTPLTAILGFADALLEPDLHPAERLAAIHTIRANGEHLLGIMNSILDVSQIDSGEMACEQLACEPRKLISEVETLMRPRAVAKGLELSVEYQSTPPPRLTTDPARVRQILVNLLSNAVKFTARGRVRLIVDAQPQADGGTLLRFDVMDTGIGITAEQSAALFASFTDPGSAACQHAGSGWGLSLSRQLARMLGGDVMLVTSRLGHGSHFRATIVGGPTPAAEPVNETPSTADAAKAADCRLPERCRILLAEDGADNRRLLLHILGTAGAAMMVVDNGQSAVDEVRRAESAGQAYDCIIMDMQMPVMDGYTATRTLRGGGYTGPIIALTAHAMAGDRQRCLEAGCDEYATKPIDRRRLLQLIAKHCRTSGGSATAGNPRMPKS